jgi:hypothetical protein
MNFGTQIVRVENNVIEEMLYYKSAERERLC